MGQAPMSARSAPRLRRRGIGKPPTPQSLLSQVHLQCYSQYTCRCMRRISRHHLIGGGAHESALSVLAKARGRGPIALVRGVKTSTSSTHRSNLDTKEGGGARPAEQSTSSPSASSSSCEGTSSPSLDDKSELKQGIESFLEEDNWKSALLLFKQAKDDGVQLQNEEGFSLLMKILNRAGHHNEAIAVFKSAPSQERGHLVFYEALVAATRIKNAALFHSIQSNFQQVLKKMRKDDYGHLLVLYALAEGHSRLHLKRPAARMYQAFLEKEGGKYPELHFAIAGEVILDYMQRAEKGNELNAPSVERSVKIWRDIMGMYSTEDILKYHTTRFFNASLYALLRMGKHEEGERYLQDFENRTAMNTETFQLALDLYAANRNYEKFFETLQQVDETVGITKLPQSSRYVLLSMEALYEMGEYKKVLSFLEMLERSRRSQRHYHIALQACKNLNDLELGVQLMRDMEKDGVIVSEKEYEVVLDICTVMKMSMIQPLIQEMERKGIPKSLDVYDKMVRACTLDYDWEAALELLQDMGDNNVDIDDKLAQKLIFIFGACGKLELALEVVALCQRVEMDTVTVYKEAIAMCRKNKDARSAMMLLNTYQEKGEVDVELYIDTMHVCLEAKEYGLILELEHDLQKIVTYTISTFEQPRRRSHLVAAATASAERLTHKAQVFRLIASSHLGLHEEAVKLYHKLAFTMMLAFRPSENEPFNLKSAGVYATATSRAQASAREIGDENTFTMIGMNATSMLDIYGKSISSSSSSSSSSSRDSTAWMREKWAASLKAISGASFDPSKSKKAGRPSEPSKNGAGAKNNKANNNNRRNRKS